jgi:hypothetical protein
LYGLENRWKEDNMSFWYPPNKNQINNNTNPYRSLTTEQMRQNLFDGAGEDLATKVKSKGTYLGKDKKFGRAFFEMDGFLYVIPKGKDGAYAQSLGSMEVKSNQKMVKGLVKEETTIKVGDTVHLGHGTKGGTGVIGKVTKIEGGMVHIKNDDGNTFRAPISRATLMEDVQLDEAYATMEFMSRMAKRDPHDFIEYIKMKKMGEAEVFQKRGINFLRVHVRMPDHMKELNRVAGGFGFYSGDVVSEETLDEMSAKDHWRRINSKGVVPPIDRERYPNREKEGLEGPYKTKKTGLIYYYDRKEGKYYNPDTDMYLQVSDIMEDVQLDEISSDTLRSYASKASGQVRSDLSTGKHSPKTNKRAKGVSAALSRLDARKQLKGAPKGSQRYAEFGKLAREESEKLTSAQLNKLKQEYGTLETIDPSHPTYKKLTAFLDKLSDDQLKQLTQAKIKFVSRLALNRVNRRKMKNESVELDELKMPKRDKTGRIKSDKIRSAYQKGAENAYHLGMNQNYSAGVKQRQAAQTQYRAASKKDSEGMRLGKQSDRENDDAKMVLSKSRRSFNRMKKRDKQAESVEFIEATRTAFKGADRATADFQRKLKELGMTQEYMKMVRMLKKKGSGFGLFMKEEDRGEEYASRTGLGPSLGFSIEKVNNEKLGVEDVQKRGDTTFKKTLVAMNESVELDEVSPPGWEGTVKAMKKKKGDEKIENPWALAWWMKGKGYKSHYTKDGKKKD